MSMEIGERPVLRPAGNVAPSRAATRRKCDKQLLKKQVLPSAPSTESPKASPTVSPPCRPQVHIAPQSTRIALEKSLSSPKLCPSCSPSKPPSSPPHCSPCHDSLPLHSAYIEVLPLNLVITKFTDADGLHSGMRPKQNCHINVDAKKHQKATHRNLSTVSSGNHSVTVSTENMRLLSFDKTPLLSTMGGKKITARELYAQRKLKIAEYGRKHGKVGSVVPDGKASSPVSVELRRCNFITQQTDPVQVAYHDEEWGVPVHNDRMLFELLVLSGAQVELSWSTILHRRDAYRKAFLGFDAMAVASLTKKEVESLEANKTLMLSRGEIGGIVENAKCILEVVQEYGSLDKYLWGFINDKPIINSHRNPKLVPLKTSKSDLISKELVQRGFRYVGPTIIYSFMQATGMVNGHLVHCFRHQQCVESSVI